MKRPRTIFAPFALVAAIGLAVLFTKVEVRPAASEEQNVAETVSAPTHKPRMRTYALSKVPTGLIVPVSGLDSDDLSDTWGAQRSEGRSHQGIDIMPDHGTPVLAAADGEIAKFHDSVRGGISIYQIDESGRLLFYYAHLGARANGLREGQQVRQGDVIGYVGATGNASTPHLHFEIQHRDQGRRWWRGQAVNPYPYLLAGEAPAGHFVAAVSGPSGAR